jgi:hypothetical protein
MPRRQVSSAEDMASGMADDSLEDDVMGTIIQTIPGLSTEYRQKIEQTVKYYVSRQAHFGGILEYTAQNALVDRAHTLIYDWNQVTVDSENAASLMPYILSPVQKYGPNVREIIILKSRFNLSMINGGPIGNEQIVASHPNTWGWAKGSAKGASAIEPDVIVIKFVNGRWKIYIIELKIGAGQAAMTHPKEHLQLMRGKRMLKYYMDALGSEVRYDDVELYFCAWMQGTKKSEVDFKAWAPAAGASAWKTHIMKGPKAYGAFVGVKYQFIDDLIKKLEWSRTTILSQIFKKFTSKTGRYHNAWKNLGSKLTRGINKEAQNAALLGTLPPMLPNPLITAKGYSNKATGFANVTRAQARFGQKSKNAAAYTKARLTEKVRSSRRKGLIYYTDFKTRYKERLRRMGQSVNQPENVFMRAFVSATPRTGSTPAAKSIDLLSNEDVVLRGQAFQKEIIRLHSGKKPKDFINAKARFNSFAAKVSGSNHQKNIRNYIATLKSNFNALPVYAARAPVRRKSPSGPTAKNTAIAFVQSFQPGITAAQATAMVKELGGVKTVANRLDKGTITNVNLGSAFAKTMQSMRAPSVRKRTAVAMNLSPSQRSPKRSAVLI